MRKLICEKDKCTGCMACYNSCSFNAILTYMDEFGHVYPYIDEQKCMKCNQCKSVCTAINLPKHEDYQKSWIAWSRDELIYNEATS